ncbi:MAG: nitroreductase family protein [Arenicella sp.]
MQALTALQQRVSSPLLAEPAPSQEQLQQIFSAALRAPDHGALTPWRFLTIADEARQKLADVMTAAKEAEDAPKHMLLKAQKAPFRAPMIIVVIASIQEGRIPGFEQEHSAAAAAQNILVAAEALGLGAIWRTGWPTHHPDVLEALSVSEHEKIIGFIYIGQRCGERRTIAPLSVDDYVQEWI